MLIPMIVEDLRLVGTSGGGGGPGPGPGYDIATHLAFALIAGYGSPSGGWMPNDAEPGNALILSLVSGRL